MEFKIVLDIIKEECKIYVYEEWTNKSGKIEKRIIEEPIAEVDFRVVKNSVDVNNLEVKEEYRKKGLGRLIMNIMMALSCYYHKPINLVSLDSAIPFYKKIGMKVKGKPEDDNFTWKPRKKL